MSRDYLWNRPPRRALTPPSLGERLRERIQREGPLRVDEFMRAALYDPDGGYYARGARIGGEGADFYTASNVSLFPHAIRRFVDAALARLEGARIVELGGGTGGLAASLGRHVTIVEPHEGMAALQKARGLDVAASLSDLREAPTLFLANEVLDALPVRRVHMTDDGPREGRVGWANDRFAETLAPLPPDLTLHAEGLATGECREVCEGIRALLDDMARAAPRALALFLDYGDGQPRPGGTLRGFREHRVRDPFEAPGEQDVTADVDFPRVEAEAQAGGWTIAGRAPQGEFLADLGLVEDMSAAMARGDAQAYLAAKGLVLSGGMGDRFRALALARDAPHDPPLPGFRKDLYPGASRR